MGSSPLISPSSDKRLWSALRSRTETLIENRQSRMPSEPAVTTHLIAGESDRANRLKEDSLLLMRGFDSVAHTLSLLSNNLDNALQGARDLAKPPTLTEIFQSNLQNSDSKEEESEKQGTGAELKQGMKRKFDHSHSSEDSEDDSQKSLKDGKLKKAKNLAISMASKAASLARELKSIKSDLCFMQERCTLLEEENRRLRDGFAKGIRPEEDDLVRLQLEALLAEKSRLANENANLVRENQCLNQLVEYHQLTSQDLSASFEYIQGMCLDFSSPPPPIREEEAEEEDEVFQTPGASHHFSFSTTSLE
ncbi:uncharacterized protein LOC132172126 isoform X2 [Corylus avellana]|nr:uncharacterized protein LOC132172126 isoform X2 [Corylus avellana]